MLLGDGRSNTGFVAGTLIVVVVFGGVVAAVLLFRKRQKRKIEIERAGETLYPRDAPIEDYRLLLERLQTQLPRPSSSTPREYALRVATHRAGLSDFVPLTECYYGARYNGTVWTDREAHRARALLRLLESPHDTPAVRE
jgi:hypothetical protein